MESSLCVPKASEAALPEGDTVPAELFPSLGTSCCTRRLSVLIWEGVKRAEFGMKSLIQKLLKVEGLGSRGLGLLCGL